MGAKTSMLVYANGGVAQSLRTSPGLDIEASETLVRLLFPGTELTPLENGSLGWTNPPDDEIYVGCFGNATVVAASEFALDSPSKINQAFIDSSLGDTIYLHAMHSAVNWLAFARWDRGSLTRSLSLSPDDGIIEDIGAKLAFETDYWNGRQPIFEPGDAMIEKLGFNFHPLSLGEEALRSFFGYQLEGFVDPTLLEPEEFPLLRFRR